MIQEALMGAGALGTLYVHLTAESSKMVSELNHAEHQLHTATNRMAKQAAIAGAAISAALGIVGIEAVREFMKFEKAMTEAFAIMGNLSRELKEQMSEVARTLSEDNIQAADELAQAYYFLASAGLDAQQSMKALPTVAKFATAGVFDLNSATTLLADAQSALGMRSKDAAENLKNMTRVADVLVKANILANASTREFSEALTNKAAAALRTARKDVEEGAAVLATFADQGLKGAAAGEALAIVLRDLQRAALQSKDIMQSMGVQVFDTSGNMRNLADIIEDLEGVLKGASVEQQRMAFQLMGFQDRSLSAILALIGTSARIREYEQALRSAGGTTEEVSKKQLESLSNQLKITKNRFDELLLVIGEQLAPVVSSLNEWLKELLDSHSALNEKIRETARLYAGFAKTSGEVIGKTAGGISTWFQAVGQFFGVHAAAFVAGMEGKTQEMQEILRLYQEGETLVKKTESAIKHSTESTISDITRMNDATFKALGLPMVETTQMIQQAWDATAKAIGLSTQQMTNSITTVQRVLDLEKIKRVLNLLGTPPRTAHAPVPTASALLQSLTSGEGGAMDETKAVEMLRRAGLETGGGADLETTDNALASGRFKAYADEIRMARDKLKILQDLGKQEVLMMREKGEAVQALGKNEIENLQAVQKKVSEATAAYQQRVNQLVGGQINEVLKSSGLEPGGMNTIAGSDPMTGQSYAIANEIKMNEEKLAALREIGDSEVELTEEVQQKKAAAIEAFTKRAHDLQLAQVGMISTSWKDAMGEMAESMRGLAGEQSGIYMAMFAASKAFAIAEATVKIAQGIANAASRPFPENLAAMASVVAATASIISSITSVTLTLSGKREKGGSVAVNEMYLVGEKGPELFVPPQSGTILSNDKVKSLIEVQNNLEKNIAYDYSRKEFQEITSQLDSHNLSFGGAREEGGEVTNNQTFLVGEKGPELYLSRGDQLPDSASIGKSSEVKVVVNNYTDSKATVTERQENGSKVVEVMIQRVKDDLASEVRDGRGSLSRAMETAYTLRRGRS